MKRFIPTLFILLILLTSSTHAHPGDTDSNGCHYCKTDCWKWGLSDNQYHCHNSKDDSTKVTNDSKESLERLKDEVEKTKQLQSSRLAEQNAAKVTTTTKSKSTTKIKFDDDSSEYFTAFFTGSIFTFVSILIMLRKNKK